MDAFINHVELISPRPRILFCDLSTLINPLYQLGVVVGYVSLSVSHSICFKTICKVFMYASECRDEIIQIYVIFLQLL